MNSYRYIAENESDTDRLGAVLAEVLPDGTTVALCGTLGAGKTRLVQAISAACGVARRDVVSPTFVLCRHYQGRRTIFHLDAYRVGDDDEFIELGVEEYFDSPAITIVEWADRVANCLPVERLEIQIEVTGQHCRQFDIRPHGEEAEEAIHRLRKRLGEGAVV